MSRAPQCSGGIYLLNSPGQLARNLSHRLTVGLGTMSFLFYVYWRFACMCVFVPYVCGALREGQRRVSDPLELATDGRGLSNPWFE